MKRGSHTTEEGTKYDYEGLKLTIHSKENDAKINLKPVYGGITVDPEGDFSNPGGIIGTALSRNEALSEEDATSFDVTETDPLKK